MERLKAAVRSLMEHFDSVQIFANRCESGSLDGTVHASQGGGNWFARFGQCKMWVDVETEREKRRLLDTPDDS